MIEVDELHALAVRELGKQNVEAARGQADNSAKELEAPELGEQAIKAARIEVDSIAKSLWWRLFWFDFFRWLGVFAALLVTLAGIATMIEQSGQTSGWIVPIVTALAVGTMAICSGGGRLLQLRSRFLVRQPYALALPVSLEKLLTELSSGRMRALLPAKYGAIGANALRTSEGLIFDTELAPSVFANRYAPLLLSSEPKQFRSLWMPGFKSIVDPIYVLRQQADPSSEDTSCADIDPDHQWIAGGTMAQFQSGLEQFLKIVPPHKRDWEKTVLLTGRKVFQSGGSQADAIRKIIDALKEKGLPYPDVSKGDAISTIKQRLQGKRGKRDITGYFSG